MSVSYQPDQLKSSDVSDSWLFFTLVIVIVLPLIASCGLPLKKATVQDLEQAKRIWQMHPVLNYSIVVDVQRQNELRRNSVLVREGKISSAGVRYWNADLKKWEAQRRLKEQQALPFTVPGLLMTVEEEISNSNRNDIRISMKGNPPVPQTIVLGALIHNNKQVEESKTFIFVRTFRLS
jgi:hypothetical protein